MACGTSLAEGGCPPCPGPPCSPLCTAMTGRWCWVKLERRGESWGDGLWKGDLSISVFFTGDEMPAWEEPEGHRAAGSQSLAPPPLSTRGAGGWEPTRRGRVANQGSEQREGLCRVMWPAGQGAWCPQRPLDVTARPQPSLLLGTGRSTRGCPTPGGRQGPGEGRRVPSKGPSGTLELAGRRQGGEWLCACGPLPHQGEEHSLPRGAVVRLTRDRHYSRQTRARRTLTCGNPVQRGLTPPQVPGAAPAPWDPESLELSPAPPSRIERCKSGPQTPQRPCHRRPRRPDGDRTRRCWAHRASPLHPPPDTPTPAVPQMCGWRVTSAEARAQLHPCDWNLGDAGPADGYA